MKPSEAALSVILALLAAPVPSPGQQPAKVYRIGYLGTGENPAPTDTTPEHCPIKGCPYWQAFVEGLRERGYIPGQNLVIECRWTEGREERAPALAAELVSLKPDLIVVNGTNQVRAAKQATSTIPIVMVGVIDPVGSGLVASLAHPGGNVTGLTDDCRSWRSWGNICSSSRRPSPRSPAWPSSGIRAVRCTPPTGILGEMEAAARALGVTLQSYDVREPEELRGRLYRDDQGAGGGAPSWCRTPFSTSTRQRIVDLAAQSRLPAMYPDRDYVEAGGLMAYEVNRPDIRRRLGFYVDKILKGAKPGDLPVEQPTKFELVINLKTAKALGLTIPRTFLIQANEVIR